MTQAIREGSKFVRRDLILWSRPGGASASGGPRFGLSVSRKMGKAVRRNRIKRLLRESFRLNRHKIAGGMDLVFYPRPGCPWKGLSDAEHALLDLCHKAGLLRDRAINS